jgi:hypothetical protein
VLLLSKNEKVILVWREKCTIIIIITFHFVSKSKVTEVPSSYPDKPHTMKPNAVLHYTKRIGGVDCSNLPLNQSKRKTKKWYIQKFFWLLDMSI